MPPDTPGEEESTYPRQSRVAGLASLATTGIFLGRSVSDNFRKTTDELATKGLSEASKLTKAMAKDMELVVDRTKAAGKEVMGMARGAELSSKFFLNTSRHLDNMAKSVPLFSKGFEKIGQGGTSAFMGLIFGQGVGGKLKAFSGGLKEVALGIGLVGRAALVAVPALLPIAAIVLAVVAAVKLIQYTVKLFSKEITEMKDRALAPWSDALQGIGDSFRRMLAPAIAFIMLLMKGLFEAIRVLGEAFKWVLGPIGGLGSLLEKIGDIWAKWIETILGYVQFWLDGIIKFVNFFKVAFGILTNHTHSFSEKWVLFGKLLAGVILDAVKGVISSIQWMVDKVLGAVHWIFEKIADALKAANKWVDWLVPDAVVDGFVALANGVNKVRDAADSAGDRLKEMIDAIKDKYGLDIGKIAAEVGVDLIHSPDLVGEFRKLLAQAKIKIEDDNLNRKLEDLGDKITKVNDKDINIEINPLIQITINGVDDPDEVRRIALAAVDEALAKAGAQLAQNANSGEL